jgi:hypothetical protein
MARQMTGTEKHRFLGFLPNFDVDNAIVTGEVSIVYNCIAWTVGIANRRIWPGNSLADFDSFYHGLGLVRSGDGTITAWGLASSQMTYGSVSDSGHGPAMGIQVWLRSTYPARTERTRQQQLRSRPGVLSQKSDSRGYLGGRIGGYHAGKNREIVYVPNEQLKELAAKYRPPSNWYEDANCLI